MSALASHISRSSGAVQTAGAKAHVRMWLIVLAALLCLGCTLASRMSVCVQLEIAVLVM